WGVAAAPLARAGKTKPSAIIGRPRFAGLPELPTMGEVGYKKLDLDFWHMLLAPAGTPRPIVDRLNAALRARRCQGAQDLRRGRHGCVCPRPADAGSRRRTAQA